jgi:hypothetical protein
MPFEPLTPEELQFYRGPCSDSEHFPPSYAVLYQWVKNNPKPDNNYLSPTLFWRLP